MRRFDDNAQIAYQLTPADLLAVQTALNRPAWGARHWGAYEAWRRVLASISLAAFVTLLLQLFARSKLGADFSWELLAGAMLGGAGWGFWWARQQTGLPPANSPIYQPARITLEDSGLRHEGAGFAQHIAWDQVSPLRDAGGCLLLPTRLGNTYFIPRRAFASPQAADAFLARAQALRDATLNPPPHTPHERLHYTLSRADIAAFFALRREARGWRALLFYLLLFPGMLLITPRLADLDDNSWLLAFLLSLGLIWLISQAILRLDRQLQIRRHPLPQGEIELQVWGDHLCLIAEGQETQIAYETLGQVINTASHVFLITARNRALIIPRHAFPDPATQAAFAAQIDKKAEASQD